MGMWDRLANVIKSYLNDDDEKVFHNHSQGRSYGDPDLNAAYEELNDFLNKDKGEAEDNKNRQWDFTKDHNNREKENTRDRLPPEELRADFTELGVPFGASTEECKEAYKKLLKIHHPDRHANHQGNFKKATEKSARINAAYKRLENWFRLQKGRE